MTKPPIEVAIGSYADYFCSWFGLKDGSLSDLSDSRGRFWVKLGDETMTAEEWNEREEKE